MKSPSTDQGSMQGSAAATSATESPILRRILSVQAIEKAGVPLAWAAIIIVFTCLEPHQFATSGNVRTILATQSVLVIGTLALLLSLAAGEFDLSVGAVIGFSAILVAYCNGTLGWNPVLAVAVALGACALFGTLNGFLSVVVGVPSIIVTLGMGTLLVGVGLGVSGSQIISGVSPGLVHLMTNQLFLGLPAPFYFGLALCLVVWFVFQHTPLGRYLVFTAENREVARLAGIRVRAVRIGGLVGTSIFAGVAGIALLGTLGAADPTAGPTFLLPVFAAAFLGSTTIVPGRFNAIGALVAVYFLVTGITGLQLEGLSDWVSQVFYGGSLVLAVTLSQLAGRSKLRLTS
jgi:ribose transport system permease protein